MTSADQMIGETFGNYRIVRLLGQGGMGAVYLAEHVRISRQAAIKVLLPQFSNDPSVLERFFAEARAAALIKHPGIVEVFDSDVRDGRAYIIMELLEGQSLAALLRQKPRLAGPHLPLALEIGRLTAEAAGAAHATGIVHRDLKPDNIYVVRAEAPVAVKVLDFGIAKLSGIAAGRGDVSATRSGMVLGTPTHMSPEQCRGAGKVDHRADIYSLGCILFEMVCGQPPFAHDSFGDLVVAHISKEPLPPRSIDPDLPGALDALVLKMLAKSPDDRPQSMAEVARELASILAGSTSPGHLAERNPTPPPRAPIDPSLSAVAVAPPERVTPMTTLSSATLEHMAVATRPANRRRLGIAGAVTVAVVGIGIWALPRLRDAGPPPPPAPPPSTAVAAPAPPATPPPPAEITVQVTEAPEGLTVEVDGRPATLPLRLPRSEEEHKLLFKAPGRHPFEKTILATRDRSVTVEMPPLATEPRPSRPPPKKTRPRPARQEPADPDGLAPM
jgi:serine/threonine-protein kinase